VLDAQNRSLLRSSQDKDRGFQTGCIKMKDSAGPQLACSCRHPVRSGGVRGAVGLAEGSTADVTDMQALRTAVRTDKKAFVASTLQLTYAEAKKVWPLYDTYQRSLDAANQRRTLVAINLVSLGQAGV
jgi:hypothetical protein